MAFELVYANQGATRNQPVSADLAALYEQAARAAGISAVRVSSGGQDASGPNRVGSHRHDHGNSGDIQLIANGRALDFTNPQDLPIIQKFISAAHQGGATGIGAGTDYMGNKTFHVGYGAPAVWGAGGSSKNAPEWLRQATAGEVLTGGGGTQTMVGSGGADTMQGGAPVNPPDPRPNPRRDTGPSPLLAMLGPLADSVAASTNPYARRELPPGVGDVMSQFAAMATGEQQGPSPLTPPPAQAPLTPRPGASDPLTKAREAIAAIESRGSGDYGALGAQTGGDRAYGRYQVMGNNIPSWSQQALGKTMTPDQFLADPASQDAIFNNIFGGYVEKYGNPQDAASVWFTGRPQSRGGGATDVNGMSGNGYVDKFNRYYL